ncbi:MAG: hypothetical protein ACE5K9_10555 [Candidatus Methylomirabilales bacterium]
MQYKLEAGCDGDGSMPSNQSSVSYLASTECNCRQTVHHDTRAGGPPERRRARAKSGAAWEAFLRHLYERAMDGQGLCLGTQDPREMQF